jgi:ABC-type tungstate transport system permease subunit
VGAEIRGALMKALVVALVETALLMHDDVVLFLATTTSIEVVFAF